MFDDYVEVHQEKTITNSMKLRTRPAICMGPSGNIQRFIKFMCVNIGNKIMRRNHNKLPMLKSIVKKIKKIVDRERDKNEFSFKKR